MRFKISDKNKIKLLSLGLLLLLIFTENLFSFLIRNIILAYIPFFLSNLFIKSTHRASKLILLILWILFYPNTVYMLTDFTHLSAIGTDLNSPYQYYHYSLLLASIFLGLYFGLYSLEQILSKLNLGQYKSLFILILSMISSMAIYVGRFLRYHTHDFIVNPLKVLKEFISFISLDMIFFIIIFTIVQLFIIVLFEIKPEKKQT